MQRKLLNAIEFLHAADEHKDDVAMKLFKYPRKFQYRIYEILGLFYEAEYTLCRQDGQRVRKPTKQTIQPLPNAKPDARNAPLIQE